MRSRYLAPVGAIGTWYVGRQTEGTFKFEPPQAGSVKYFYPRMTGIVYGDGTAGHQCR